MLWNLSLPLTIIVTGNSSTSTSSADCNFSSPSTMLCPSLRSGLDAARHNNTGRPPTLLFNGSHELGDGGRLEIDVPGMRFVGSPSAIVDGGGASAIAKIRADGVVVENVLWRNGNASEAGPYGSPLIVQANDVIFRGGGCDRMTGVNGGCIFFLHARARIENGATFSHCYAAGAGAGGGGGAIYNDGGLLTIADTIFRHCSAREGGGAIWTNEAVMTVSNTIFESNAANQGAAWFHYGTEGNVNFFNCTFRRNIAHDMGTGTWHAGVLFTDRLERFVVADSLFEENQGGCIYTFLGQSQLQLRNTKFIRNTNASHGAALANDGGTVTVRDCFFDQNSAIESGGVLFNLGPSTHGMPSMMHVENSTFTINNTAGGEGALVMNKAEGHVIITNHSVVLVNNASQGTPARLAKLFAHSVVDSVDVVVV